MCKISKARREEIKIIPKMVLNGFGVRKHWNPENRQLYFVKKRGKVEMRVWISSQNPKYRLIKKEGDVITRYVYSELEDLLKETI